MLKFESDFVPIDVAKVIHSLTAYLTRSRGVQPTGNETLVERWVLHKLNLAAAEVNKYLEVRNFMAATNAVYNFWLYELCDVYIVRKFWRMHRWT